MKAAGVIVVTVVALFSSLPLIAAGPESIDLPAIGLVSFPHLKHQEMLKNGKICHVTNPGRIPALGKDWAHNTCKVCHLKISGGLLRMQQQ